MTLSRAHPNENTRPNVTPLKARRPRGSQKLNEALGIHAGEGLLIDICFNKGSMWRGLAYRPLRCDIDPTLPHLDIVASWNDLPNFVGAHRAVTVVGDPIHVDDVGKKSTWRQYVPKGAPADTTSVLEKVEQILAAGKKMLVPVGGTLILKLNGQVHDSKRQWEWFETLKLADKLHYFKCDEYLEDGAHMSDTRRLHRYHFDSQVRWLVLHTGTRCPGPGLTLPGRARCAFCGRVVACRRVRTKTYCRRPRRCRQAAYEQRRRVSA